MLRIALGEGTRKLLSEWKSNLEKHFPGISISYPELVGWAVEKVGLELSKKDQLLLRDRFFDEVKQLEWLLAKARAAKTTGDKIELPSIVFPSSPKASTSKKTPLATEETRSSFKHD